MLFGHLVRHVGTFAVAACLPLAAMAQSPGVNWRTNLDAAKLEAAQSRRLLLVHFTTRTCGPCKMLDQHVFSQPQVAAAIEQDYVPVRIDADASQALAASFRIDRVPTELIMTPEGNVLVNPPIPDKPEPYVAQIQNLARHFRQTTGSAQQGVATPAVNPAYAGLPVGQTPNPAQAAAAPALQAAAQQPPPQSQANPFVNPSAVPHYGQTQSVYAAPPQQPPYASPQQPSAPTLQPPQQQQPMPKQNPSLAGATTEMPTNAMPQSYRDPAAAVAVVAPKPHMPQLPAGAPPLAFDGCCPVTLKTVKKWTVGDQQFGAVHRGRTYLFAGVGEREQFLADPDAYSPVFAGMDPVVLIDKQQSIEGSRTYGYEYGGLFYLFSSKDSMEKFAASPHTYAAGVRQAMNRIDAAGDGTVRR